MIGTGILKGMAVTARNFVGSYFEKDRLITVQYPEERIPLPENYRNFPFLPYDGDDPHAGLRCVACKICEKECPAQDRHRHLAGGHHPRPPPPNSSRRNPMRDEANSTRKRDEVSHESIKITKRPTVAAGLPAIYQTMRFSL